MYYLGWISLVVLSLWASLAAFIWAFRSGQFSEQGRARYLPLSDEYPMPPVKNPTRAGREMYALLVVAALALVAMVSAIALTVFRFRL